tara:strand:- start:168 stop:503 length:336 start_codon:yes stop_codon:yes gene_type:complete
MNLEDKRLTVNKDLSENILFAIDCIAKAYSVPITSKDFKYGLDSYFYVKKLIEDNNWRSDFDYQYTVHFETARGEACYLFEFDEHNNPKVVDMDLNAKKFFDYFCKDKNKV